MRYNNYAIPLPQAVKYNEVQQVKHLGAESFFES
jgi:hypothetical protein